MLDTYRSGLRLHDKLASLLRYFQRQAFHD